MSIKATATACLDQFSRADFDMLARKRMDYALEWVQWAQRTGMRALQGYTPGQLHRIADEILNVWIIHLSEA